MGATRHHALEEAARFSGRHTSQVSQMGQAQSKGAVSTLERLSKPPAKPVATARHKWPGLPWDIALIVARTLHHRASLHPANAQPCNQGPGFVVGHQWTNVVWLINDRLMPRRPIPFYRQ